VSTVRSWYSAKEKLRLAVIEILIVGRSCIFRFAGGCQIEKRKKGKKIPLNRFGVCDGVVSVGKFKLCSGIIENSGCIFTYQISFISLSEPSDLRRRFTRKNRK
jgi:hypothetical protein